MTRRLLALLLALMLVPAVCRADETIDRAVVEWESYLGFYDVLYRTSAEAIEAVHSYCTDPTWQTLRTARLTLEETLEALDGIPVPTSTLTDKEIATHYEAELLTIRVELNGITMDNGTAYALETEKRNEALYRRDLYNGTLFYDTKQLEIWADVMERNRQSLELECLYVALTSRYSLKMLSVVDEETVWTRWKQEYPYVLRDAEEIEKMDRAELEEKNGSVCKEIEELTEKSGKALGQQRGTFLDFMTALDAGTYSEQLVLQGELPAVMPLPSWGCLFAGEATVEGLTIEYFRRDDAGELVQMTASDTDPIALCRMMVTDVSRAEYMAYIEQVMAAGCTVRELDGSTEMLVKTEIYDPDTDTRMWAYHQSSVAALALFNKDILLL